MKFRYVIVFSILAKQLDSGQSRGDSAACFAREVIYG
jgi:hypothetical protein